MKKIFEILLSGKFLLLLVILILAHSYADALSPNALACYDKGGTQYSWITGLCKKLVNVEFK